MNSQEFTPDSLGHRFSARLHKALDQLHYPSTQLDRARTLASNLDIDEGLTSTLLKGLLLPEWDIFVRICALTKCQPGYFLDESVNQYPPETRLVKPLTSGDNIVVRIPHQKGSEWGPASADWTYLQAKGKMGFGIVENDFVVNFADAGSAKIQPKSLYLVGVRNTYEVRACIEVAKGRAVLACEKSSNESTEFLILPMAGSRMVDADGMRDSGINHIGQVATLIRGPQSMRSSAH